MRRRIVHGLIILVLISSAAGYMAYHLYDTSRKLSEHIYEPLPSIHLVEGPLTMQQQVTQLNNQDQEQSDDQQVWLNKSFAVLIIGVDQRSMDKGRSDVLMVATVNPNESSSLIMNIPRDTRTTIAGLDIVDKINHSYAYGGIAMTIATVERLLDIPIDYYIKVDMEGFQEIIDTLGGVEVDNTFEFQYEGHDFPIGTLELQGEEALAYVRMRYEDPQGDLGRNERQKQVVKSVLSHLLRTKSLFKLMKIVNSVEDHVRTNITFEDWKTMSVEYREALVHVETENLNGYGQMLHDIYYYIVDDEEKNRVSERLRLHLDYQSPEYVGLSLR